MDSNILGFQAVRADSLGRQRAERRDSCASPLDLAWQQTVLLPQGRDRRTRKVLTSSSSPH